MRLLLAVILATISGCSWWDAWPDEPDPRIARIEMKLTPRITAAGMIQECGDQPIYSAADPGTPDYAVTPERLKGRQAARNGIAENENPYPWIGQREWYLGHLDERLKKHYAK